MQKSITTPAAIEAFRSFYLSELDNRIQRSEPLGVATGETGTSALFYEHESGKFTLLEKPTDVEEAIVYDCLPREQWGRTAMVFGHSTNTGGYIASGHGTLEGNSIKIKLANGNYYRIGVDGSLAFLAEFTSASPPKRPSNGSKYQYQKNGAGQIRGRQFGNRPASTSLIREKQASTVTVDDDSADFTEEDLMCLRGEIPITERFKKHAVLRL